MCAIKCQARGISLFIALCFLGSTLCAEITFLHRIHPYYTHQPILYEMATTTTGPIIEFGCGYGSTDMLHEICKENKRLLISLDDNFEWISIFKEKYKADADWHKFYFVPGKDMNDIENPQNWVKFIDSHEFLHTTQFDVCFVDQHPFRGRLVTIQFMRDKAKYIILHDCDYFPTEGICGKTITPLKYEQNGNPGVPGKYDFSDILKYSKVYFPPNPWPGETGPPTLLGSDFGPPPEVDYDKYSFRPPKVAYSLSTDPIDVAIYAQEKNLAQLDLCIDSLRTYGKNLGRIFIISSKPLSEKAEWFDERKFPFSKESIIDEIFRVNPYEKRRYTHHPRNQQDRIYSRLIKLYAPFVIPGLSQNVLILDPDILFLRPIEFMDEQGSPLLNSGRNQVKTHCAHALKMLPDMIDVDFKEFDHFALVQKPILEELFLRLRKSSNQEPWQIICDKIDRQKLFESPFSDFSLYTNYAFLRTDQAKVISRKTAQISDLYSLSKYEKEGYAYIRYCPLSTREY